MGPPIIELMVTPASSQTFYISLTNQSDIDMNCNMSVKAMAISEAGLPYPVDNAERDAQAWIKINDENTFLLKAQENRRIRCTIKPPLKVKPGGYYAMILSRLSRPQNIKGARSNMKTSVRLTYQFASVLMAIVKGANVQARINPDGATIFAGNRTASGIDRNWYVIVPIRNDGNIHVVLEGNVEIYSQSGQLVKKMGLIAGKGYILPEQRREFRAEGSGPLPDGVYVANIRLGQTDISKYATERIPFYVMNGQVHPGSPDESSSSALDETSQGFILNKNALSLEGMARGRKIQVVRITNITSKPIEIESLIRKWDQDAEGNVLFPESTKHGNSLDTNIVITPMAFTLEPDRTKNVKLVFSIPEGASGEYYDAILFNRKRVKLPEFPALLEAQSVLTSVKVKTTEQPKLTLLKFDTEQIKDQGVNYCVDVKNEGNVSIFPDGNISIFDNTNSRVGDIISFGGNSFILPQNERRYKVEWKRLLPVGKYRAEVVVRYASRGEVVKDEFRFSIK